MAKIKKGDLVQVIYRQQAKPVVETAASRVASLRCLLSRIASSSRASTTSRSTSKSARAIQWFQDRRHRDSRSPNSPLERGSRGPQAPRSQLAWDTQTETVTKNGKSPSRFASALRRSQEKSSNGRVRPPRQRHLWCPASKLCTARTSFLL